jgi:hypothetical protein
MWCECGVVGTDVARASCGSRLLQPITRRGFGRAGTGNNGWRAWSRPRRTAEGPACGTARAYCRPRRNGSRVAAAALPAEPATPQTGDPGATTS